jgi:hypothetical protein
MCVLPLLSFSLAFSGATQSFIGEGWAWSGNQLLIIGATRGREDADISDIL